MVMFLQNTEIPMLYALRIGNLINTETNVSYHKDGHGYWNIQINNDGTVTEIIVTPFNFHKFHGFMMWAAWGIFGLIQLATNRYLKVYWRYVMWVHRISGTIILLITFIIGILAIKNAGWTIDAGIHQALGLITLIFVLLIVLGGVFNRSMMQRVRWNTKKVLTIKTGHKVRYFAFITFFISTLDTSCSY